MSQNHKVSQRSLLAVMIFSNSFSLIMILKLKLPDILPSEMTPLVEALLAIIGQLFELFEQQKEQISQLKDEIRVLKKQKKKPAFKPSKMDEKTEDSTNVNGSDDKSNKTNHRQKKSKTSHLSIHSTEIFCCERKFMRKQF